MRRHMDHRHAIDGALLDQPVDDAIVDIGETPALCTCDARQSEDKTSWIGNGEIAGIMDQFIDTIGLRGVPVVQAKSLPPCYRRGIRIREETGHG